MSLPSQLKAIPSKQKHTHTKRGQIYSIKAYLYTVSVYVTKCQKLQIFFFKGHKMFNKISLSSFLRGTCGQIYK